MTKNDFRIRINKLLNSKNIRNSGWLIGEKVFQMLITITVGIWMARYLGPRNYGALNYTASIVALFINVMSLGMDSGILMKKIIEKPEDEGVYFGSCILLRLISACFSTFAIGIIVILLDPNDSIKLWLALLQSLQLFFKAFHVLDIWFQRYLKSKYVSIASMAASIVVSVYKIFLLMTSKNIIWFAISNSLVDLVIAVILLVYFSKECKYSLRNDFRYGVNVLKETYHFVISDLIASLFLHMDKIMIAQLMSDDSVGLYTAAVAISEAWTFVPMAIIKSFRSMIIELKNQGNEYMYKRRLIQLNSLLIWVCIAASIVISIIARFAVSVLYGESYMETANLVRIIVWSSLFAVISTARTSIWVIAEEKVKFVKYFTLAGTLSNLVLNVLLISMLGLNGAAIATLAAQIMIAVIAPLLFNETRESNYIVLSGLIFRW